MRGAALQSEPLATTAASLDNSPPVCDFIRMGNAGDLSPITFDPEPATGFYETEIDGSRAINMVLQGELVLSIMHNGIKLHGDHSLSEISRTFWGLLSLHNPLKEKTDMLKDVLRKISDLCLKLNISNEVILCQIYDLIEAHLTEEEN